MKAKDIMNPDVSVIPPDARLSDAARMMKAEGVGMLPVCEGDRLVGAITDRDIVIRAVAEDRDCQATRVQEAMTAPIVFCYEDEDAGDLARIMEARSVRRLVVLNRAKRMTGILSVDDLAESQELAGEVLSQMTESFHRKAA